MFDAQMAVESLGVELAAQKASPEDIHHLIAILDEAETLQDNQVEFTKKLLSFHLALVETSRNRVLVAQMQAFIDVQYTTYLPWTTPTISRQVLKRHRALVGKIQQGDADGAREMIVNHLKRVRKRVWDQSKSGTVSETE
jgi:DNA-binding FadR family transcriptional regulator